MCFGVGSRRRSAPQVSDLIDTEGVTRARLFTAAYPFAVLGDVKTNAAPTKRASMFMLKSDVHYFPEADDPAIAPFARAFVRMMFAHAELEDRIRELPDALTDEPRYGEKNH